MKTVKDMHFWWGQFSYQEPLYYYRKELLFKLHIFIDAVQHSRTVR